MCVCISLSVCLSVCLSVFLYVSMYVSTYVRVHVYVYVYVHVHVDVDVYVHVYVHVLSSCGDIEHTAACRCGSTALSSFANGRPELTFSRVQQSQAEQIIQEYD